MQTRRSIIRMVNAKNGSPLRFFNSFLDYILLSTAGNFFKFE
jgi:hypothetical protein